MPASKHNSHPNSETGNFYVVATPIGNLADISQRALQILADVDVILAEDTRHSRPLLNHYGITTPVQACHEHNEADLVERVVLKLREGVNFALISDAGTPLISDPGFVLVRKLQELGLPVRTVPGASSLIAALSIAGLPTDRFIFDGFLPPKQNARCSALQAYENETRTVVLLESSHRIVASIADIVSVLGADRKLVIARELTKKFETVLSGAAQDLLQNIKQDRDQQKGEFVLIIASSSALQQQNQSQSELKQTLSVLLEELPVKQAASLAAKLTGGKKNSAYEMALALRDRQGKNE